MIVNFKGETTQEHPGTGVLLRPGLNDLPDAAAQALLDLGLVAHVPVAEPPASPEAPPAPAALKKGKTAKDADTSGESRG